MYGIASIRPLPFKFPPVGRRGMTEEGKRSYEALPPDAQHYLDQFDDGTTKPKHNDDDDEDVWNCNAWKSKTKNGQDVPDWKQVAPKPLPYGTLTCFRPKTHLDFHDASYSKISDEEYSAWKRYRESLPPEMQSWLNSFDDPVQTSDDINQAKSKRKYEERKKPNSNMKRRKYEESSYYRRG